MGRQRIQSGKNIFYVDEIKCEINFCGIYFAIKDLYDNLNFTLLYTVYSETCMFLVIVLSYVGVKPAIMPENLAGRHTRAVAI